jgi:transcriptional regulator with XRE-family HTH domain
LRKWDRISQFELAEKLGTAQQAVSKYERGLIELDTYGLMAIAEIFNVIVDYFPGITNLPNNEATRDYPAPLYM